MYSGRDRRVGGDSAGNNSGNKLNEVVRQLTVITQQLTSKTVTNGDSQGELFKRVAQCKPPTYQGEPDPTVLENWIREFEKLFGAVGYPIKSQVSCVVYYLIGEANLWWQQNKVNISVLSEFGRNVF